MMARLHLLAKRLRNAVRREDGTASLEFVIIFPLFVTILISSIETGVLLTRQVMLERAMDIAVRDLRLGQIETAGATLSRDDIRNAICASSPMIANCQANLLIELREIDTENWSNLDGAVTCIERGEDIVPPTFQPGTQNDLMLIRGCALVDPMFPTSGFALNLPREATGAFALVSQTIFVIEPS
jgi:Flp pilus assembly protein TadG